ncbi:MAG TPA: DUF418 domain-containing protein [Chitinophagaceae bacterium]|nr:DUF418 domain-containing protein [Chitinophagaceae bacterium]
MDTNTPQPIITETARPVTTAERIKTIDIVRGVALLGILLMNISEFGIDWSIFDTIIRGAHDTADFRTLAVIETFFHGTLRGLFSMLFGAGMILFTMNKKEIAGGVTVAELYYRRLLVLVLFGVINAYVLLWPGDILYRFGVAGMLLYPFRKTAAKWLFLLGILCIAIGIFKSQLWYNETREKRAAYHEAVKAEEAGKKLTAKQQLAEITWLDIENGERPDPEESDRNIRKMHSGYGTIFSYFIPWNSDMESWRPYLEVWEWLSMMFIGMALFRLGFFSNKLSTSTYVMALIIGYGIGIALGWVMFSKGWLGSLNFGAYVDAYRVPHRALRHFRIVFLCIGHASLILLVFRSRLFPWLMKGLANVGQMAFTNYLMQSIICALIFYGFGLGYYNHLKFHQLYFVVAAVWIFQLIFSSIWLRFYLFGPFEWLWRSLTYWNRQPMMK